MISGRTNTVTTTLPVSYGSSELAVNERTNTVYAPNGGPVTAIDGRTNTVSGTITGLTLGDGLATDSALSTLYVTNVYQHRDALAVVNEQTNTVTSEASFGGLRAYDVALNPDTHAIYVTCGGNTVVVLTPR